jgi:hypothetical protein
MCMKSLKRFMRWLFADPPPPASASTAVIWWESRRIAFNIVVGPYCVLCFCVYAWGIVTSGGLPPGEDLIEPILIPLALVAGPICVNIAYTLGWLVEVPARLLIPDLTPRFSARLLMLGFAFSFELISIPAAYWGGYRVLQLAGLK